MSQFEMFSFIVENIQLFPSIVQCTVLQLIKLTILPVSLRFAPDLVAVKCGVQTGSKLSKTS